MSGAGFPAGAPLAVDLFSEPVRLGNTIADASRSFRLAVVVPIGTTPGVHTLRVSEVGTGLAAETTLEVLAPAPLPTQPTTGSLSRTGGDLVKGAVAALGLLLAGFLFVGLSGRDHHRRPWPAQRRCWP